MPIFPSKIMIFRLFSLKPRPKVKPNPIEAVCLKDLTPVDTEQVDKNRLCWF